MLFSWEFVLFPGYYWSVIIVIKARRIRQAVKYHAWGDEKYKLLVGKTEGKKTVRTQRRTQEDNIEMYLKETGCEGMVQDGVK
jgi:hypothetical protein